MKYNELKKMWLSYLSEKGHTIIPTAPVIPDNDPSTLFVTAGMQPLVPFLLGERHPGGKRLANIQRCVRTNDIDEVGDDSHLTFFEMMGNWSLGDYFKKEKIVWSYEFLTSKKYLGIPKEKIHVTCFEGDAVAPRDEECAKYWLDQGVPKDRIHFLPKSENWWGLASGLGPQGPCSEMFFQRDAATRLPCKKKQSCNPSCDCGNFVELGNDVYMQYVADKPGEIKPAKQLNVDTGWGLERILCFVNGHKSVYETELFKPALDIINSPFLNNLASQERWAVSPCKRGDPKGSGDFIHHSRIIAEHTRAACAIIADGVVPSNTGAGYVLRRLIRRAVRSHRELVSNGYPVSQYLSDLFRDIIKFYSNKDYLDFDFAQVEEIFRNEVNKFIKSIDKGIKEFEKEFDKSTTKTISGKIAFHLYETYGFPIEITQEMARERGFTVNIDEYNAAKTQHTMASKTAAAAAGTFKGGLADSCQDTIRLHTSAHILLAVLRKNYGNDVHQKGSNITAERLRFDFSLPRKLEPDELVKIENQVNQIIAKNLDVTSQEMSVKQAQDQGAIGTFCDRYGSTVKVFTIGKAGDIASKEICGGPHVKNTRELGKFKIQKEESSGQGVRRIKAILTR